MLIWNMIFQIRVAVTFFFIKFQKRDLSMKYKEYLRVVSFLTELWNEVTKLFQKWKESKIMNQSKSTVRQTASIGLPNNQQRNPVTAKVNKRLSLIFNYK